MGISINFRKVKVHVRIFRLNHLPKYCAADNIPRCKVSIRMCFWHETITMAIPQNTTMPSQNFTD